jgi:hypothetical protein
LSNIFENTPSISIGLFPTRLLFPVSFTTVKISPVSPSIL